MTDDQHRKQFQPEEGICNLSLADAFFRGLGIMKDDQHRKPFEAYEDICNIRFGKYLQKKIRYYTG